MTETGIKSGKIASPKILTIIICTYNRNEILQECLDSLAMQSVELNAFDILIVNNFSSVKGSLELSEIVSPFENVKIINEENPGLSIARNTGANHAKTRWIGFVDDDCRVPEDFIARVLHIINQYSFDCFGGHIESWWLYGRPDWLNDSFGTKPKLTVDISMILEDYLWGGNLFIQKEILQLVGGFDDRIGMKSNKIGYSAENRLQINLRKKGYSIGYDPNLVVHHLVSKEKLQLKWHIRSAYAEGRDARKIFPEQYTLLALCRDLLKSLRSGIYSTYSLVIQSKYSKEHWVMDVMKPAFRFIGKIRSFF